VVRRQGAYFVAGHRLLDSLTRPLPVQQCPDQDYLRAAVSAGGPALSRIVGREQTQPTLSPAHP
jgi:hypothetical protein